MNRRDFLKTAGLGLASLCLPGYRVTSATAASGVDKPNILFILGDDVGITDVSCSGGDWYHTPNIDALANAGTRFEYEYASPLCGPSRCEILTGRYPFRTGLINNTSPNAISPSTETMMPTVLKQAGYVTGCIGKWGQMALGPLEWGFDEQLGLKGSGCYTWNQAKTYQRNGQDVDMPVGKYFPDIMHDFAVDFINRHKDQPFYLYYPMVNIHLPMVQSPDSTPCGINLYTDCILYMDKLVGKIVDELDRLGLREKTLIIYVGDNGTIDQTGHTTIGGRYIWGHKGQLLEGGSRVPLVVNWQGTTPAGVVNHDLIDFSDFFVTLAELAGAPLPSGVTLDGQSFVPQIKGQTGTPRDWVYVELDGGSYARGPRFKLTNGGDLFDLSDAPFQEIPVPVDTKDPDAIAARTSLQLVLNTHVAKQP